MDKALNFKDFSSSNISEAKVYQDFDSVWDYKFDNGKWLTRRKTSNGEWKDISKITSAVNKLNKKYFPKGAPKPLDPKLVDKPPKKSSYDHEAAMANDPLINDPPPEDPNNRNADTIVSKGTNPEYLELIRADLLSSRDSTKLFKVETTKCAQFVNDFTDKFKAIGNAWIAHNTSALGRMVYDAFDNLDKDQIHQVIAVWQAIHKNGGPDDKGNGKYRDTVAKLVDSLIPDKVNVKLKLDDIVGLYYPNSKWHEYAFYDGATKPNYFIKKGDEMVPGKIINRGEGWGMNTHLGIVGAIKDGKPIIFHNVYGQVYGDPVDDLHDCKVAWVRRPTQTSEAIPLTESANFFLNESKELEVNLDITDSDIDDFKKNNIGAKYRCMPNEKFRFTIHTLLDEGYDVNFLKVALGIIGRESTYATGKRYDYLGPLKNSFSEIFGVNTSIGPAQMKQDTADSLGVKEDITTIKGATIAAYKYIEKAYDKAIKAGYSPNEPSINFKDGTGSAAFDMAIASYNLGMEKIDKYCETSDPKRKRSCSLAGKTLDDGLKVTSKQVKNYLPNYKTERYDDVKTSTHGYVKEVADYIKSYRCF